MNQQAFRCQVKRQALGSERDAVSFLLGLNVRESGKEIRNGEGVEA